MTIDTTTSSKKELNKLSLYAQSCPLNRPPETKVDMLKQVLSIAVQPDFINNVEKVIGDPKDNETKEEYINRAEKVIIKALKFLFR